MLESHHEQEQHEEVHGAGDDNSEPAPAGVVHRTTAAVTKNTNAKVPMNSAT